jgi:uncharacterized protein (TIGR02271 family)
MTTGHGDYVTLQPGMDVYASDGGKVGTIAEVAEDSITVEKGFFFPNDYIIPIAAVEGVDENDNVHLLVTKDAALNEQWSSSWDTGAGTAVGGGIGRDTDTYIGTEPGWDAGTGVDAAATMDTSTYDRDMTTTSGEESTRVPVYEEELTPVKRAVSRGAVRISKEVVTENRTITVPVTEERVRVTHVDTDVPASADAAGAFEEGYIEIPVTGEEVSLEKTARQTGEVVVDKERVQRDESVGGTVRREEVHVDEDTMDVDVESERRNKR